MAPDSGALELCVRSKPRAEGAGGTGTHVAKGLAALDYIATRSKLTVLIRACRAARTQVHVLHGRQRDTRHVIVRNVDQSCGHGHVCVRRRIGNDAVIELDRVSVALINIIIDDGNLDKLVSVPIGGVEGERRR